MTTTVSFLCFKTPVGPCGLAWGETGLAGVRLPEPDPAALSRHLAHRFGGRAVIEPPDWIADLVARIRDLMDGGRQTFGDIPYDWSGVPAFHRRVYEEILAIPPGRSSTYGAIALALGEPGAARAVGRALGANPFPIVVPCHRVLAAGAGLGGFSAPGGRETKLKLLALEGLDLRPAPDLFARAGL